MSFLSIAKQTKLYKDEIGTKNITKSESANTDSIMNIEKRLDCLIKNRQAVSDFSDPLGARTQDPNIKSVVLYQLS